MKTKNKTITETAIVIPDTHGQLVDKVALNCVCQAIRFIKPDRIIHLGDVGEFESLCLHNYKKFRQIPQVQELSRLIRTEIRATIKDVIDPIDKACEDAGVKIKDILIGNHDNRLNEFVEAHPDYARMQFDEATGYTFEQIIDWKRRNWTIHPFGKILKIGKLNFYHGHLYGGVNHARNHLLHLGDNVMYGHWHDVAYYSLTALNGTIGAWSLGCVKRLDYAANRWLNRRPVNWGQAFAIIDWWGTGGMFTVHVANIIKGRCSLITKLIDGRQ